MRRKPLVASILSLVVGLALYGDGIALACLGSGFGAPALIVGLGLVFIALSGVNLSAAHS